MNPQTWWLKTQNSPQASLCRVQLQFWTPNWHMQFFHLNRGWSAHICLDCLGCLGYISPITMPFFNSTLLYRVCSRKVPKSIFSHPFCQVKNDCSCGKNWWMFWICSYGFLHVNMFCTIFLSKSAPAPCFPYVFPLCMSPWYTCQRAKCGFTRIGFMAQGAA